mmetsp:Transcript_10085/g.11605  ORF Transcript_10085/g.11605 Transcript_10085/m.11605 type:complete len:407 (+) Transcript_10085:194-1414(+)
MMNSPLYPLGFLGPTANSSDGSELQAFTNQLSPGSAQGNSQTLPTMNVNRTQEQLRNPDNKLLTTLPLSPTTLTQSLSQSQFNMKQQDRNGNLLFPFQEANNLLSLAHNTLSASSPIGGQQSPTGIQRIEALNHTKDGTNNVLPGLPGKFGLLSNNGNLNGLQAMTLQQVQLQALQLQAQLQANSSLLSLGSQSGSKSCSLVEPMAENPKVTLELASPGSNSVGCTSAALKVKGSGKDAESIDQNLKQKKKRPKRENNGNGGSDGTCDSEDKDISIKRSKRKYTYKCREVSSFKVFLSFVKESTDGSCDASGILSPACFNAWVDSRKKKPKKPEEAFRRALTAHCRGVDGRRPFEEKVEKNLLKELRKKKPWACFSQSGSRCNIGIQGFPALGYHEGQSQVKSKKE